VPAPVPEAGPRDNHAALSFALQLKVPLPVLLMLKVWPVGLLPPCWAVKERLVGLAPIAGLTESTGTEVGEINSSNPGISAANFRIDRPPPPPFPGEDELPLPGAASGMVPVGAVSAVPDPVASDGDVVTLMVARGVAAPMFLLNDDNSPD
jgi:hypothetical protein